MEYVEPKKPKPVKVRQEPVNWTIQKPAAQKVEAYKKEADEP